MSASIEHLDPLEGIMHVNGEGVFGDIAKAIPIDTFTSTLAKGISPADINSSLKQLACLDDISGLKIGGKEYGSNMLQNFHKANDISASPLKRLVATYKFFLKEFNLSDHMESVQTVRDPLVKTNSATTVIGDVHGDMNVLLGGLVGSGLLQLDSPPIMMYRLGKSHKKVSLEEFSKLQPKDQKGFQPILICRLLKNKRHPRLKNQQQTRLWC